MSEQRKYRAKAVPGTAVIGTSAKKGTPQISVELELVDTGERMTWTGYFSDAANQYTVKNMRTLGFVGDDVDDLSSIGGVEVDLVIEDEEYNGRLYPKIKFINAIGGGGSAMDDRAKKAFAAKMKGVIRAVDAQDGAARPPAAKASAANPARQAQRPAPRQPVDPPPSDGGMGDIPF